MTELELLQKFTMPNALIKAIRQNYANRLNEAIAIANRNGNVERRNALSYCLYELTNLITNDGRVLRESVAYDPDDQRCNQERIPLPPGGFKLIAATYGSGPDSYLGVVLCFRPDDGEWVTWMWNAQNNGFAHGHYFNPREGSIEEMATEAVADFTERSRSMMIDAAKWDRVSPERGWGVKRADKGNEPKVANL